MTTDRATMRRRDASVSDSLTPEELADLERLLKRLAQSERDEAAAIQPAWRLVQTRLGWWEDDPR